MQCAAGALTEVGVRRGDRVVLLLGDKPEFPLGYFGAMAAGAVATPLSSQLSTAEIAAILDQTDPRVVLAADDLPSHGSNAIRMDASALMAGEPMEFAPTRAEDPALLVFTSGSSGRPKGVLHAHRAFWARRSMHKGWHDIGPNDRVMHAGAFNWTFTLGVGLADTWSIGATAILNAGIRAPEAWPELARRHDPTIFAAAPAVYRRVLKYGSDLGTSFQSLRHAVTAGETLDPAIAKAWSLETGKPLLEALGMSEVSTYISTPPHQTVTPGQVGWPQPGRHVAVLNAAGTPVPFGTVGDLAVDAADPGLMLGYWQDPEATRAAYRGGWFITGDLVRMESDGAITYAGRCDDQMNVQGYRVDPREVEAALALHPGVAEVGVTALQVSEGLSIIAAWIVPGEGAEVEPDAVLATARMQLADYKLPRGLFLAKALPHSANGKLIRRDLPGLEALPLT